MNNEELLEEIEKLKKSNEAKDNEIEFLRGLVEKLTNKLTEPRQFEITPQPIKIDPLPSPSQIGPPTMPYIGDPLPWQQPIITCSLDNPSDENHLMVC